MTSARPRLALPPLVIALLAASTLWVFASAADLDTRAATALDTNARRASALSTTMAVEETPAVGATSLADWFLKGGWLMWPIALCSVIGVAVVIERFLALRRSVIMPQALFDQMDGLIRRGEIARAEALCRERPQPLAKLLRAVLLVADGNRVEMESCLEGEGARVIWELRRNGKALGVIASIAPLLGLLGTVWGMIRAFATFAEYAAVQGVPPTERLAVGIYEALITTAAGLLVAIPCLLFHHYFRGRADTLVREMEDLALDLIHTLTQRRAASPANGDERQ